MNTVPIPDIAPQTTPAISGNCSITPASANTIPTPASTAKFAAAKPRAAFHAPAAAVPSAIPALIAVGIKVIAQTVPTYAPLLLVRTYVPSKIP